MPGFLAGLDVSAETGLAVVAFANATSGPDLGALVGDLVDVVATAEPRDPEPWAPLPDAEPDLLALTGPWYWGATPFAVRLQADRHLELVTLGSRGRESRFRPGPDGRWTGLDGYYRGETLAVVRDASGDRDPPRPGLVRAHPGAVRPHVGGARRGRPGWLDGADPADRLLRPTPVFRRSLTVSGPEARFCERASENRQFSRRSAAAAGSSRRAPGGRDARGR